MGLFDLFRKKEERPNRTNTEWFDVAASLSGTLWTLLQTHPEMLASTYSRVVLRDDWSVGIACDKRSPEKVLSAGEVSFVFLREDQRAYDNWTNGLRKIPDAVFQKIETERFAKVLVRKLAQTVDVVD
jgi:hypothetical protein